MKTILYLVSTFPPCSHTHWLSQMFSITVCCQAVSSDGWGRRGKEGSGRGCEILLSLLQWILLKLGRSLWRFVRLWIWHENAWEARLESVFQCASPQKWAWPFGLCSHKVWRPHFSAPKGADGTINSADRSYTIFWKITLHHFLAFKKNQTSEEKP